MVGISDKSPVVTEADIKIRFLPARVNMRWLKLTVLFYSLNFNLMDSQGKVSGDILCQALAQEK